MSSKGSISLWIGELKDGKSVAEQALWQRYFPELVRHAHKWLNMRAVPRAKADEEDVVLSAMHCFYRAAQNGRYPDLADRDGLWRLLLQITNRKAIDLARSETSKKAGGGRVQGESAVSDPKSTSGPRGLEQVASEISTPEFAVTMADQCRRLLELLEDPQLVAIALARLEGYNNEEIASRVKCSLRTVERRLKLIRALWKEALKDTSGKRGNDE